MISLIICSIDPVKFDAAVRMYTAALGDAPWELIGIHDAKSLAEGYNRAISRCRGDTIIFSHDDVEVISPQLPQRLAAHLARFDLIGVAGTSRVINAKWFSAGPPHIFGQVAHFMPSGRICLDVYGAPHPVVGKIQALDGLFMAARRLVLEKIRFDEITFDGFHIYDVDFSFQAYKAGFRVAVANDINLMHQSIGNYNVQWQTYADRFTEKWKADLPDVSPPLFQWAAATVATLEEAKRRLNPPYWNYR
jgi:hypothetical protein